MIALKDRHESDVGNCPIVETECYKVYLGIQDGWVKMKSFKGGFLDLATFYHRGYENWRFGGVGDYPTPDIVDNVISVVDPQKIKDLINSVQKSVENIFKIFKK
jgi:hypothetical protein